MASRPRATHCAAPCRPRSWATPRETRSRRASCTQPAAGAMVEQVVLGHLLAVAADDEGLRHLAEVLVVDADRRGLGHGRMRSERVLDLARVDVEATDDHDILLAIDERQRAIGAVHRDVAGVQPAVTQGVRRLVGHLPVAAHHLWPTNQQLTRAPRRNVLAGIEIDAAHIGTRDRRADASRDGSACVSVERERGPLRHAVALPDRAAGHPLELRCQAGRQRSATGEVEIDVLQSAPASAFV